jgi:hypothetical protein
LHDRFGAFFRARRNGLGNPGAELGGRVGLPCIQHDQGKTRALAGIDQESVAILPALMRLARKLYDTEHRQVVRVAQDKIQMPAVDSVQRSALCVPLQARLRGEEIAEPHFAKHPEIVADREFEHGQERAFGRGEKNATPLIGDARHGAAGLQSPRDKRRDQDDQGKGNHDPEHAAVPAERFLF